MGIHKTEKMLNDTLRAIEEYLFVHGETPTYKELGRKLRISDRTAEYRVKQLKKQGRVTMAESGWRKIRLKGD